MKIRRKPHWRKRGKVRSTEYASRKLYRDSVAHVRAIMAESVAKPSKLK